MSFTLDPWVTIDPATGTVDKTRPDFTVFEHEVPIVGLTANP